MQPSTLAEVAAAAVRRAQRQGFVLARDVRSELKLAGLDDGQWKAVLALAKPELHYRQGRYYPLTGVSPHLQREQDQQRAIQKAVRRLLKQQRGAAKKADRRDQERVDFVQPVKLITEEGKAHALLSRDISPTGIRMIGAKRFLGQKVHLEVPVGGDVPPTRFLVRVLWTCAVGDDLFENGGSFLAVE